MTKRTRQPVRRDTEARTRSGLLSLFWMFIGAVIAVMVGLFLYLSPLFDSFRKEVDVNPPATVTPLPQDTTKAGEYEFYEILPKREFRSDEAGLGESPEPATPPTPKPAPQESASTETLTEDVSITIVEENATYDDPTPNTNNPPTPSTHTEDLDTLYFIRIRAKNSDDADNTVSQLLLMGVDAKVEARHDTQTGETLYYVVSDKMIEKYAKEAHQLIYKNGIDSILVEVRP